MRVALPKVEWPVHVGVNTKFNPELVRAEGMLRQENADTFGKFLALGKVPGSTRQSQKGPGPWHWLEYFESFDLTGALRREVLGLCLDRIFRIEADQSLSFLEGGYTGETLRSITADDRLYFTSPNNDPRKYDGATITRWGVQAPGLDETVVLEIDDHTDWTLAGAGNAKSDTGVSQTEGNAVRVDKLTTAAQSVVISRGAFTADLTLAGQSAVSVWLFIPGGAITKLRDSDYAVHIRFGDFPVANYREYRFTRGNLSEGWNLLTVLADLPDATVGAPPSLNATAGVELAVILEQALETQAGFIWSKLYHFDAGTPEPVLAGVGNLTGTFRYRVTYVSKYGLETNAGPASEPVSPAAQQVTIYNVPRSTDPQVIARRVYRDLNGDGIFRLLTALEDNTTTAFTDNVDPTGLSLATPPLLGDTLDDNRHPPRLRDVARWKGHVFGINAEDPFAVEVSALNDVESYPLVNLADFEEELLTFAPHQRGLMLHASDRTYILEGDTLDDFRWTEIHPEIGAAGTRAVVRAKGIAMVWHDDGPYLNEGFEMWYVGSAIKDQLEALDADAFREIHLAHDRARFRVLAFAQAESGGAFNRLFSYRYGQAGSGIVSPEGAGVDPLDLRVAAWSRLVLPASVNPLCSALIERGPDQPELWIGCSDGRVYRLQDPAALDYATDNGSEPVAMVAEFGRIPLEPEHSYGTPRYLALGVSSSTGATLSCTVSVYEGPQGDAIRSVTFDLVVPPGDSNPIKSIPKAAGRGLRGPWVNVSIANARAGEHVELRSARVYYVPGRFRGRRAA